MQRLLRNGQPFSFGICSGPIVRGGGSFKEVGGVSFKLAMGWPIQVTAYAHRKQEAYATYFPPRDWIHR